MAITRDLHPSGVGAEARAAAAPADMPDLGLVCPVHGEALREEQGPGATTWLVGVGHGERYPVAGGVPVLIADPGERRGVVETDWSAAPKRGRALDFYNRTDDHDGFLRTQLDEIRGDVEGALGLSRARGPVLEIGSGKGALQGIGGDYVALDYSLTALTSYVRAEHRRVCASAERLPFRDGAFRFVLTIASLEHVPGADRAFAEIDRVLAPGGVAYLAPAWHCEQYNCEGIPVRPYADLDLRQRFVKATLPLRQSLLVKALRTFPARVVRRALWSAAPAPTSLRFDALRPDYETFWTSDSDAASRLDSHRRLSVLPLARLRRAPTGAVGAAPDPRAPPGGGRAQTGEESVIPAMPHDTSDVRRDAGEGAARPPDRRWRLAALISHPIQYVVPMLRLLAQHPAVDLTVYFTSDTGIREREIVGVGRTLTWDVPLLDGYRHEFLPDRSPWPNRARPLAPINPGVVPALARGRFDAVLLHGYNTLTDLAALAEAKALGLPVLFWGDVHRDTPLSITRSQWTRDAFRRGVCALIDAALPCSGQASRYYERYGVPAERSFWAPLCVDADTWSTKTRALRPRRAELLAGWGLDPALPVVAYVANMRPNKRPKDVLQALERMKVPASLLMVGEGPLLAEVVRYTADHGHARIRLLGSRNQSELSAVYACADVFVLPSSPGEITPLVVQEAMWGSLPLVISDAVPSIIDFVREGENGFTFPVGDVDALADRLDRVLGDPATRARMGARSHEIIEPWNYGVTVGGIVDALAAVAPHPRAHDG